MIFQDLPCICRFNGSDLIGLYAKTSSVCSAAEPHNGIVQNLAWSQINSYQTYRGVHMTLGMPLYWLWGLKSKEK